MTARAPDAPNPDVWILDAFTSEVIRLTQDPNVLHVQASWSPNDDQIVLRRHGSGLCGKKGKKTETALVVINSAGSAFPSGCTEDAIIQDAGGNLVAPHWWPNHVPVAP